MKRFLPVLFVLLALSSGIARATTRQQTVPIANGTLTTDIGSRGCRPAFPAIFVNWGTEHVQPAVVATSDNTHFYNMPVYPNRGGGWHAQATAPCSYPLTVVVTWTPDGQAQQRQEWGYSGTPGVNGRWAQH